MTENSKEMNIEEKRIIIADWVTRFENTGEIGEIDTAILKEVFVYCGADFEHSPESLAPLGEYTNKAKRPGLNTVWGEEAVDGFWDEIDFFIGEHEVATAVALPELKKSGYKFSGMRQFFGEITALAADQLSFEDFKEYSEARIFNGIKWREGKKDERIRITVPTKDDPILLSSYPQEFPRFAIDTIFAKGGF